MNGYRANRIERYFESKERLTISDHKKMQGDFTCLPGKEFVSIISNIKDTDDDIQLAVGILRDWDGQLTKNSVAGAIYEVTRYHMLRNILEPTLGDELSFEIMGKGFHPVLKSSNEFNGHDTVTMLRMLDNPKSWWIGQAGGKETVIKTSLKQAIQWLRANLGEHSSAWQWGNIHGAVFPHPLGLQKPLDQVFNRGPFPIGGDMDTPCQTAFHAEDPYHNNAWAPSFRQIVNMDDLSQSLTIIPPGQSGQLGNPHYDDLISPWLEGNYHPMLWTREQVEANTEGKLIIKSID